MGSSKSRRAKRRTRCGHQSRRKPIDHLQHSLSHGAPGTAELAIESNGGVQMSAVLTDFVGPYFELADTNAGFRRLLTLAVAAWNASLLPKEEQEDMEPAKGRKVQL